MRTLICSEALEYKSRKNNLSGGRKDGGHKRKTYTIARLDTHVYSRKISAVFF